MKTDKNGNRGKLIIDDLSENAHRVRRNLLIFSFIAIFYKLSGASISENGVSFYGINFQHIDQNFISIGIFLIVLYHLFHFLLIAIGHWQYLKIRVTRNNGEIFAPGTFGGSDRFDNPDYLPNPKDSSLFSWHCQHMLSLEKLFSAVKKEAEQLSQNSETVIKKLNDIKNCISSFDRFRKSTRFIKSLTKFDNCLKCYNSVELFRFVIIEILFPLMAGFFALGFFILEFCRNL